ncbi:MAG: DUF815 domain-containing protein [Oscillospiraceae bacterium]|nr:DUF815 domain-containing protein [Oscillospiraceae bacterium]
MSSSGIKDKKKHRLFDETGKRLVREMKPLRWWILLCAFLCLILIGCAVAIPELLGGLVDRLYAWTREKTQGLAESLLPGIGILFGAYALQAGVTYGNSYLLNNVVSRYFCAGLRIRLSDKLRRLPVSYMDKTPAGEVIDRMMDDVSNMSDSIHFIVDILISGFLQMTVIALILFLTDWRMAIPVVLLSPLSVLLSAKMATLGENHWDKHFDLGGELTSLADRVGLAVRFGKPDKKTYLAIVHALAARFGVAENAYTDTEAEAFALKKGSRSPRAAKQFVLSKM